MEIEADERAARARKGGPFLDTRQAAFYVHLSHRTLEKKRGVGDGPCFRKHGRLVRYHIDDLDVWSKTSCRMTISHNKAPSGGRQSVDRQAHASGIHQKNQCPDS